MMKAPEKISQPYSLDQFLSENWAKREILIPGEYPGKFQELFSWEKFNHLLNFHELKLVDFLQNGEVLLNCAHKDWVKRCQKGATLKISYVHELVSSLAELTWAIQQETGHSAIHGNIYVNNAFCRCSTYIS